MRNNDRVLFITVNTTRYGTFAEMGGELYLALVAVLDTSMPPKEALRLKSWIPDFRMLGNVAIMSPAEAPDDLEVRKLVAGIYPDEKWMNARGMYWVQDKELNPAFEERTTLLYLVVPPGLKPV